MLSNRVGLAHCLLIGAMFLGGCTSGTGKVTLQGDQGSTLYSQSFAHAYISSEHSGEYDVVLMQDAQQKDKSSKSAMEFIKTFMPGYKENPNAPLQPMTGAELRQIVHIHVFWQADGGTVAKDGVVTNAAINWYMIAYEATEHPEVLRYEGAGVVILDEGRKSTSVAIRDGIMKKTQVQGGLKDPLGPSHLNGVVQAEHNPQFVRDILADLKARNATKSVAMGVSR